jgi:hypothetical protein
MKNLSSILIIIFFLISCQKETLIKSKPIKAKIVLNCLFNNVTPWNIEISKTIPAYDTINQLKITNAIAVLFANDKFYDSLKIDIDSNYKSKKIPEIGINYNIKVYVPGFEIVEGIDKIPNNNLPNIHANYDDKKIENIPPNISLYNLELHPLDINIKDNNLEKSYYKVSGKFYNKFFLEQDTVHYDKNFYKWEIICNNKQFSLSNEVTSFLFDNLNFINSEAFLKSYSIQDSLLYSENGLQSSPDGIKYPKRNKWEYEYYLDAELLSETAYKYNYSYQKQNLNSANPFSEYQAVYSNIKNGLGIFAGSRYNRIKIK